MIEPLSTRQAYMAAKVASGGGTGQKIKFWIGTRPTDTNFGALTLAGTCPCASTSAGAADSTGKITFNAISTDNSPTGTGTISCASWEDSAGVVLGNMSVGLSAADVIVNSVAVASGVGSISVTAATATFGAGS